jgi:hypothetical protein
MTEETLAPQKEHRFTESEVSILAEVCQDAVYEGTA